MTNKIKKQPHKQYSLEQNEIPSYNEDITEQEALGSIRKTKVLEVGFIRSKNYKKGVSGWELNPQGSSFPLIVQGSGAPGSAPSKIGDIYIDTNIGKIYISSGTDSSADWRPLN